MRNFIKASVASVATLLLTACMSGQVGSSPLGTTAPRPASSSSAPALTQTTTTCASITGHLYEACFAYIVNDAEFSLQPYYKYVHSDSIFASLRDRLPLKYRGQALQTIQRRTVHWPTGTNTVRGPDITIRKGWASLVCNKAVLVTRESWTVIAPSGKVLYQERGQTHTVVLRRVPDERFHVGSHVLHQWVVYAIYNTGNGAQPGC